MKSEVFLLRSSFAQSIALKRLTVSRPDSELGWFVVRRNDKGKIFGNLYASSSLARPLEEMRESKTVFDVQEACEF